MSPQEREATLNREAAVWRHRDVLDALQAIAYREAKDGFTLPGIGKLVVVNRKARIGRNPRTGEQIQIPAKRALKFRIAKAAKDAVL